LYTTIGFKDTDALKSPNKESAPTKKLHVDDS